MKVLQINMKTEEGSSGGTKLWGALISLLFCTNLIWGKGKGRSLGVVEDEGAAGGETDGLWAVLLVFLGGVCVCVCTSVLLRCACLGGSRANGSSFP